MKNEIVQRLLPIFLLLVLASLSAIPAMAGSESHDIKMHPECLFCGMDREKFAHSRIVIHYRDKSETGLCSLHCAAVDMAVNLDKTPASIQAGDYNTKQLVDAEAAFWVIGGDLPGVMTRRAKWAFEKKADAEQFVHKHGGQIADFETAVRAAYEDMYQDTRMIREKREKKRAEKKVQTDAGLPPAPGEKVKCPVCGMFVAKYPHWVAVITFADGTREYFDGAKDFFKYYLEPEKYGTSRKQADIQAVHVTEYYGVRLMDARSAFFVADSDVFGPMGRELVPFASQADAEAFMKDHSGQAILKFDAVTPELLMSLDGN